MSGNNKDNNLSLLLKKLLKEQSFSLRKFSELIDIDPATLSRIINGKRKATPDHLQRFAESLGVPISELFVAAGFPIQPEKSELQASIDNIQGYLESSDPHFKKFTLDSLKQELVKYEQYSQTEEGKETILHQFQKKIQKVNSIGPFIDQLKAMYDNFHKNKGTPLEITLIGSALLYFILPLDCIPDYIFPIGYLDDAIVVKLISQSLQNRS